MLPPGWLWIPVTIWAAFAQTLRNAAQRSLSDSLGTLGATLVRFLYGLPFAALWLWLVQAVGGFAVPAPTATFAAWVVVGAVAQIVATALLLRVMAERNFALGVAYSKTEIIQVAVFGLAFLGDPITTVAAIAIVLGNASFDPHTMLDAVWLGGGGEFALARHAVAALLNAAHPDVNYQFTVAQIIAGVQNAYTTGNFEPFKTQLDFANNAGCPLN